MVKEDWLCCSNKTTILVLKVPGMTTLTFICLPIFLWLQYDYQQDVSLQASSPGRSTGWGGKRKESL